jgi:hypothetical protein
VELQPQKARVRRGENGSEEWREVPVEDIRVGDVILIPPGERKFASIFTSSTIAAYLIIRLRHSC